MTIDSNERSAASELPEDVKKALDAPHLSHPADRLFVDAARAAFTVLGCTPLDFCAAHPSISVIELARRLAQQSGHRVSAAGVSHAIYDDAEQCNVLKATAKDQLIRVIQSEFPEGWVSKGDIRPTVKLAGWHSDLVRHFQAASIQNAASCILKSIAITSPPPEGWRPLAIDDPWIDAAFERCWPNSTS